MRDPRRRRQAGDDLRRRRRLQLGEARPGQPDGRLGLEPDSSEGQRVVGHGIGVGDMNNDGRVDIVVPTAGTSSRAKGISALPWTFHAAAFGNGGGEIGVYDVNGDKLTDVVTSLSAHDWGLAWFEQKRTPEGTRLVRGTHNRRGLLHEEHRGRRVLRSPCLAVRRHDRRQSAGIHCRQAGTGHISKTTTDRIRTARPVADIYRTVRNAKAPGGASSCRSSSTIAPVSVLRSR